MIKRISLLMVAALMAAMMMVATAAPAFAASPSETQCESQPGATADSFQRDGGKVSCTIVDEGKPHPNDKFDSTDTVSSNGTLNNRPQKQDPPAECSDTGSGKCPPGQF